MLATLSVQSDLFNDLGVYEQEAFALNKEESDIRESLEKRGYIVFLQREGGKFDGAVLCPPTKQGASILEKNLEIYKMARVTLAVWMLAKMMPRMEKK